MKNYRIKSDIRHSVDAQGQLLVVSVFDTKNCFYRFTGLTKDVFFGLESGKSPQIIVQEFLHEYEALPEKIEADVSKLIVFFLENKIIEET